MRWLAVLNGMLEMDGVYSFQVFNIMNETALLLFRPKKKSSGQFIFSLCEF